MLLKAEQGAATGERATLLTVTPGAQAAEAADAGADNDAAEGDATKAKASDDQMTEGKTQNEVWEPARMQNEAATAQEAVADDERATMPMEEHGEMGHANNIQ